MSLSLHEECDETIRKLRRRITELEKALAEVQQARERAEQLHERWRMIVVEYLKSILGDRFIGIDDSGDNLHWASVLMGRLEALEGKRDAANELLRRALELIHACDECWRGKEDAVLAAAISAHLEPKDGKP